MFAFVSDPCFKRDYRPQGRAFIFISVHSADRDLANKRFPDARLTLLRVYTLKRCDTFFHPPFAIVLRSSFFSASDGVSCRKFTYVYMLLFFLLHAV